MSRPHAPACASGLRYEIKLGHIDLTAVDMEKQLINELPMYQLKPDIDVVYGKQTNKPEPESYDAIFRPIPTQFQAL